MSFPLLPLRILSFELSHPIPFQREGGAGGSTLSLPLLSSNNFNSCFFLIEDYELVSHSSVQLGVESILVKKIQFKNE